MYKLLKIIMINMKNYYEKLLGSAITCIYHILTKSMFKNTLILSLNLLYYY